MKMRFKIFILLLISVMAVMSFVACNGSDSNENSEGNNDTQTEDNEDLTDPNAEDFVQLWSYYYDSDSIKQAYDHVYNNENGGVFINQTFEKDGAYIYSVFVYDENITAEMMTTNSSSLSSFLLLSDSGDVIYAVNPLLEVTNSSGEIISSADYATASQSTDMVGAFIDILEENDATLSFDSYSDFIATGGGTDMECEDNYYLLMYPSTGDGSNELESRKFCWYFIPEFQADPTLKFCIDAPDILTIG